MNTHRLLSLSILSTLTLAACDRPPASVTERLATPPPDPVAITRTLETARLGEAMERFESDPSALHSAAVKKALAQLDGEIAELEERVAKTSGAKKEEAHAKLKNLKAYRDGETARYNARLAGLPLSTPGAPVVDTRTGAEKAEDAARQTGASLEHGAQKVGNALEEAARKTGEAVKDITR